MFFLCLMLKERKKKIYFIIHPCRRQPFNLYIHALQIILPKKLNSKSTELLKKLIKPTNSILEKITKINLQFTLHDTIDNMIVKIANFINIISSDVA